MRNIKLHLTQRYPLARFRSDCIDFLRKEIFQGKTLARAGYFFASTIKHNYEEFQVLLSLTKKHRGPRFGIVSFLDSTLDPWRMQSETQKETSTLEINGTLNMEYNESIEHFLEFPEPNELLLSST